MGTLRALARITVSVAILAAGTLLARALVVADAPGLACLAMLLVAGLVVWVLPKGGPR